MSRLERVKVQYDMLPKYFNECKLKGNMEKECKVLYPELRRQVVDNDKEKQVDEEINNSSTDVPVIKFGRHFKRCHHVNKILQKDKNLIGNEIRTGEGSTQATFDVLDGKRHAVI